MTTNTTAISVAEINRRQFVAIGASTAALSAVSSTALADSVRQTSKTLRLRPPSLARVVNDPSNPTVARLQPDARFAASTLSRLAHPLLTLTPLPCVDGRLDRDASITIELHYPAPNLYTNIYSAHNITIPNQSIPAYPSSTKLRAPRNTLGKTTLKITQRIGDRAQTNRITLDAAAPGTYLLAVPTAPHSSNASFRFSTAQLDTQGNITNLTNPMPAASSRCAYFSITINDKSTGE